MTNFKNYVCTCLVLLDEIQLKENKYVWFKFTRHLHQNYNCASNNTIKKVRNRRVNLKTTIGNKHKSIYIKKRRRRKKRK